MQNNSAQPAPHIDPATIAAKIEANFAPEQLAIFQVCSALLGGLIGSMGMVYQDLDIVRLAVASWGANEAAWVDLATKLDQAKAATELEQARTAATEPNDEA